MNRYSNNNGTTGPPQVPPPATYINPGLSDIQKNDLNLIWNVHSIGIASTSAVASSSQSSSSSYSSVPLDMKGYEFIAALTSFFISVLGQVADERLSNDHQDLNSNSNHNNHENQEQDGTHKDQDKDIVVEDR